MSAEIDADGSVRLGSGWPEPAWMAARVVCGECGRLVEANDPYRVTVQARWKGERVVVRCCGPVCARIRLERAERR